MTRLRRPDRRDGFLILIGALSLLLGYAYVITKVPPNVHTSLSTVTRYVPLHFFAAGWLLAGFFCVTSSLFGKPSNGFAVAMFMPVTWGTAYFVGWCAGDAGRGWITACIFWALAAAVYCVAGLIDPTPVIKRRAAAE